MFVLSKRNIVIPAPDGSAAVRLRAGMMETVPGRAAETAVSYTHLTLPTNREV